jgi:WD40 repeat protein
MRRLGYRLALVTMLICSSRFAARCEPQASNGPPVPEANKTVGTDLYGDPLPPRAVARLGTMRLRHAHGIGDTALSADGKTLATGSRFDLRLWDVASGKLNWQVPGSYWGAKRVSPNGKWLAVNGESLFDAATGRLVAIFPETGDTLAFSPDSRLFAVGSREGSVIFWDTATGKEALRLSGNEAEGQHKGTVAAGAFTPDGQTFIGLFISEKRICHWNITSGKLRKTVEVPILKQQPGRSQRATCRTLRLSPDGHTLAVIPDSRDPISLWDTDTGEKRGELQGEGAGPSSRLAFSSDGRALATNLDRYPDEIRIFIWDAETGKLLRQFAIPRRAVGGLEWTADGRTLVVVGSRRTSL